MNRIKQEDVTVAARFKENRKPTATVFDNSMIIAIPPDEVIVTDRFFKSTVTKI